ncbi:DUF4920 domain-containing protein [Flavobacterium aciduliphilum]|uniref:Uncharacterized protein DUF4920 n=1 Tax=Flavobacterium aciduliphilum TaxID=1101402 RepID=A0A328YA37_9FLAO|nr:DUF4920 domain-containing protein [Flavobacterium aciduliphilum]RAR70044.1 uncharacterized protein DUF4920 [Flavobacterium aciduliphilum]
MKKIVYSVLVLALLVSCKKNEETKVNNSDSEKVSFVKFGDSISEDGAISAVELLEKYKTMKPTDTVEVKVHAKIVDVCQKKGCWMNLDLGNDKTAFVKFKDYGFFVPKNAGGSEAIVHGKAFVEIVSVNDLKEYAKDAGKSNAAIDSIIAPETNYSFMADGVLIKK